MIDLERARQAIARGLLPAIRISGRPRGQKTLAERLARYRVPGLSAALIADGEIAWTEEYGLQEAGGDAPVTGDTRFQAASISKAVTAVAALRLVQEGVLDLDTDDLFSSRTASGDHLCPGSRRQRGDRAPGRARTAGTCGLARVIPAHVIPAHVIPARLQRESSGNPAFS
jgi:beta-lactamase family protein